MSYEVTQQFSKDLTHSFLSRIGFLLNKIHQEQINSYDCDIFSWEYDTQEDAETRSDCVLVFKPTNLTFKWNGSRLVSDARIFVSDRKFCEISSNNNLAEFVQVEKTIMEHIIKKEKEMIESLTFKMEINTNRDK